MYSRSMELILKIYWLWTQFGEHQEMFATIMEIIVKYPEVIALIATSITAGILAWQTKENQKRTKKQNRLESINLSVKIEDKIIEDDKLKKINNTINVGHADMLMDDYIEMFLNRYEGLAMQWNVDLIEIEDVYEIHGDILVKIKKSKHIQNFIEEKTTNDDGTKNDYFSKLLKLLDANQKFYKLKKS